MSLVSFDRLLSIIEIICDIILSAIQRIKKEDTEE